MRDKNRSTHLSFIAVILLTLLLVSGPFSPVASGQSDLEIALISLESGFPEIRANVRIVDGTGRVPTTINPADIEVYEDGRRIEEFEIVEAQTNPQLVALHVDSGINTSYVRDYGANSIRAALSELVTDGYIQIGEDRLILTERINETGDQTFTLISASSQNVELPLALRNISFAPGPNPTEGFIGLEDALNQMDTALGDETGVPSALIFFVHNINWPPQTQQIRLARAISDQARAQGTRIYVIHANALGDFPDPLELMTESTGGLYINLAANDVLPDRFVEIFEDLEPQSQTFTVRYNSQSVDPGDREIAIVPAGVPVNQANAIGKIGINPAPVSILVSASQVIRRTVDLSSGSPAYTPNTAAVVAQVESWPFPLADDGLAAAELLVNGLVVATLDEPSVENLIFDLDISNITAFETLLVQVRLIDKTGLSFRSLSSQVTIDVEPIVPTSTPTAIPTITLTPSPFPTPFVVVEAPAVTTEPQSNILPWALAWTMFLALLGFGAYFVRKLNSLEAGVARRAYQEGGLLNLTRTIITGPVRGDTPIARLHVLEGPQNLIGQSVDIVTHNINIGRDPRQCDILIYDGDEHSSISGLHCIIQYDLDHFKITDGSSNGTKLNGESLQNDLPTILNDEDEIILGDLFRRGAKLRFEVVDPAESKPADNEKDSASLANLNVISEDDPAVNAEPDREVGDDGQIEDQPVDSIEESKDNNWMSDLE